MSGGRPQTLVTAGAAPDEPAVLAGNGRLADILA